MSFLLNRDQIPLSLIEDHDRFSTSNTRCIQFEIQVALIPDQNKFQYQSAFELVRTVEGFLDLGSAEEYFVHLRGISDTEFEQIECVLQAAGIMATVRFTFEKALDAAILRIQPVSDHDMIAANFAFLFTYKIAEIPGHTVHSVSRFGAGIFWIPGIRSKERDEAFRPRSRSGRDAWPSVMVGIGYAGGMDFLRLDTEWWLLHSNDKTRFVILMRIERDPFALRIECWMMVDTSRRQTRLTPNRIPLCVQDFDINRAGKVVSKMGSTELEVPYDSIFDDQDPESPLPPSPPAKFSFSELSEFALMMFADLTW